MEETPGYKAWALVQQARADFQRGYISSARQKLEDAYALKDEVDRYNGLFWQVNHHDFTGAMLDMAVLKYKLGNFKEGNELARRAQAWADDPNCNNQWNFDRSFRIRRDCIEYFLSGLIGRFRSIIPV
jgi:hypothetical protein